MTAALQSEQKRTGIGVSALLRGTRHECPAGLNASIVNNWINGTAKTGCITHYDYLLSRWKRLPDADNVWMQLTSKHRQLLKNKVKETGMSAKRLFAHRKDQPKGFDRKNLSSYYSLSRHRIKKDFYRYIIRVCDENKGNGYVPFIPKIQRQLQAEIHRSGLSPAAFMREVKKEGEPKFNQVLLYSWLRGEVETLDRRLLNEVLRKYAAFPGKAGKTKGKMLAQPSLITSGLKPINSVDLAKMRQYRDVLGILPGRVFDGSSDIPPGLTRNMVSGWLNGATGNANPDYVKWVIQRCREIVKAAIEIEKQQ